MRFQTFDEAEKSVAAVNAELQFKAVFGELTFLARCSVRQFRRYGKIHFELSPFLATVACMVPSGCRVSYLTPTSQLGVDALGVITHTYRLSHPRKKEAGQVAQDLSSLREKLTATAENNKPKRKPPASKKMT